MTSGIKLINKLCLPIFKHISDACCDCKANLKKAVIILPFHRKLIPLGFSLQLPENYEAVIRPRSGNSKKGVDIAIGTIDAGYTGEVMACVINSSFLPIKIKPNERICQLAIRQIEPVNFVFVETLKETDRNADGFGSTGSM